MTTRNTSRQWIAVLVVAAGLWLLSAAPAGACAVCGGDPDSDMVKGAESGVLLMIIVTYGVLLGFAGLAATWFVRSRRLARLPDAAGAESSVTPDDPDGG